MIIDARIHAEAIHYQVYHAEQMRFLKDVVWANDETMQYGQYDTTYGHIATIQAKRVAIIPAAKLVLINGIGEPQEIANQLERAAA